MAWTEDMIAIVRSGWETGLSASAIGRQIGVTKNAVLGKKRILGLSKRYSSAGYKIVPVENLDRAKAMVLAGASNAEIKQVTQLARDRVRIIRREVGKIKERRPSQIARVPKTKILSHSTRRDMLGSGFRLVPPPHGCLFPIGEPGKPGFSFCNAQIQLNAAAPHSYCDEHRKRCYIHVKALAA